MNIFKSLVFGCFLLIYSGCTPWKQSISSTGGYNEAIRNAIIDFSSTSSLFKDDSSFSVTYLFLQEENLHLASILGTNKQKTYIIEGEDPASRPNFPNNYYIHTGKLFYWHDEEHSSLEETLFHMSTFNLLDTISNFFEGVYINDDAQAGMDYYFCKDNISSYKKVKTTIAYGYYPVPKVKCGN